VDSTIALVNWGRARVLVCLLPAFTCVLAQSESPSPSAAGSPFEETIVPTFETQKLARTYVLDVPAPRGLITDRNGIPFAQNRLMFNLAISFPTPLDFSDPQLLTYTHEKIQAAEKLLGRSLKISDDLIKRHYHNRGILPLEITQNLNEKEADDLRPRLTAEMTLRPYYVRIYPQGRAAGQIVGYSGKTSRTADGIIDNHEVLWPETEGREGLEQTFNQVLTGKHGEYKITFDKDGRKTSEKITTPPVPGHTVVTTLDIHLQELAEQALEAKAKRGAIVIVEPYTGDILAMASWPTYNPNNFTPTISAEKFKALQDDPDIPLLPRAFRSSYPPGSTFKVAVGIAALESRAVRSDEEYDCMPALTVGNVVFHNWKKTGRGALNFVEAMTESCDTWFYQVGIKTGAEPIIEWAQRLGFGVKCGIPLRGEVDGRVPTDQYMKATHGRKLLNGDIANLSIGQGDTQATPLQMAQAMAIIGNGGTFYQTRLVQQVQTVDNEIVTAFQVREKKTLGASADTMAQLRTSLVNVVNGPAGTAHQSSLENVEVAGKTGTAQWGPKNKERTAAWFAGFVPADKPQMAFAAVYEGDVGSKAHGGSHAAPMIAMILKDVYKENGKKKRQSETSDTRVRKAEPVEEDDGD
jgi:penicillin-binding protein 2